MADTIKAKVKTERLTMEISGGLDASIDNIFLMIGNKSRREAVLKKLNATHERMTERENQNAEEQPCSS